MLEEYSEVLSGNEKSAKVLALMEKHRVSSETGFLAESCPRFLPKESRDKEKNKYFETLDDLACLLPRSIEEKRVNDGIKFLPVYNKKFLSGLDWQTINRTQLIISMLAHAWFIEKYQYKTVFELMKDDSIKHLIPQLSVPLWDLHKITGIAPSMSYCLYSLWNYYRPQSGRFVNLENGIEVLNTFTGTVDEKWFIKIHQMVEIIFAPAIFNLLKANLLISEHERYPKKTQLCWEITDLLEYTGAMTREMVNILERMREQCDIHVYYDQIRIFYSFPRNVIFDGVIELKDEPQNLFGETGAQSPFMHFLDYMLGIDFDDDNFLPGMQRHMPGNFRKFLKVAKHSKIRDFILDQKKLNNRKIVRRYNALVQSILDWRAEHLSLAYDYIEKHGEGYGTGKSPMGWLQSIYDKTRAYLID